MRVTMVTEINVMGTHPLIYFTNKSNNTTAVNSKATINFTPNDFVLENIFILEIYNQIKYISDAIIAKAKIKCAKKR